MNQDPGFLGSGWAFPPGFEADGRQAITRSGEADILDSLRILLSTAPGERVMRPDYGCDMTPLLFEPIDTGLKTFMADRIRTAILYYEPRIDLKRVSLAQSDDNAGLVLIEIEYVIRATNSRLNQVFPFYRNEGTQV